ncbi:hypothetical protein [Cytobacillus sp. IB215665]|uniref:hypothetical protein n=1 Tax=Cytobacillus sp. IB215665 TaxID=3097357 RepID=UPI002A164BF4|nr:hypothetical protein [Cytobacillus sp. IB215665]MDX8365524.1 hypothetical protein [Cytobacillus sp. IB215665]
MKKLGSFLLWPLLFTLLLWVGTRFQIYIEVKYEGMYIFYPILLYSTIFPYLMGMFFRLPSLLNVVRSKKALTFDIVKFLVIVLPASIIASFHIIYFSPLGHYIPLNPMLFLADTPITIISFVAGYMLLSCIKEK